MLCLKDCCNPDTYCWGVEIRHFMRLDTKQPPACPGAYYLRAARRRRVQPRSLGEGLNLRVSFARFLAVTQRVRKKSKPFSVVGNALLQAFNTLYSEGVGTHTGLLAEDDCCGLPDRPEALLETSFICSAGGLPSGWAISPADAPLCEASTLNTLLWLRRS